MAETLRELLLRRLGLVFLHSHGPRLPDEVVEAVEAELARIGQVPAFRLRERLARASRDELGAWLPRALAALTAHYGGGYRHTPLFASFPEGIPHDMHEQWLRRVVSLLAGTEGQACPYCGELGTTHVLQPCHHVVCASCFDGRSYTACPACERAVDTSSPFFQPAPVRERSRKEQVVLRRLELGDDLEAAARSLFVSLCERPQPLSPDDRDALACLVGELGVRVHAWLPEKIPVRENVALIFGTLLGRNPPDEVLPVARGYLRTATDVLRVLVAMSGADPSLQGEQITAKVSPGSRVYRTRTVKRFKVARLSRPLRRGLFGLLESFDRDLLVEDMLRHRSYWVWLGEFLHPGEFAARFPAVARGFEVVRQHGPDGAPAPVFRGWASRLEAAVAARDGVALLAVLGERPGELARRLDRALRSVDDPSGVLALFASQVSRMATPVLLTLASGLPHRARVAPRRVYWPKGKVARGVIDVDCRPTLPSGVIDEAVRVIEAELLCRFADKGPLDDLLVDERLAGVIVPFNERTATRSAVALPRGSRVPVPMGKVGRLFMHWCQPEKGGEASDLDLSVGFYDAGWQLVGTCSYCELHLVRDGVTIARSAGDRQDAPFPDGASEMVDVHVDAALAAGFRYAVVLVNNYSGMPFSQLERAFAGLMWRDDIHAEHFDPRTVALRFDIAGENGIFLPLVLDLREGRLHWLDVQARGGLRFNNLATSDKDVARICPAFIDYFASGERPSMFDLALLHAAARARRVHVRGAGAVRQFVRGAEEPAAGFLARLRAGVADEPRARLPASVDLAFLFAGDVELAGDAYVLFPGLVTGRLAAADLL